MFTRLIVQVTDTAFPKTFVIPMTKRITLGRSDIDDPTVRPDVDLLVCNAIRNGISRNHAVIDQQSNGEIVLYDLGSRNGTCLNGVNLQPHRSYALKDGDQVRLGHLQITVFFE